MEQRRGYVVISRAVIDCGFGDSGKGKTVSYLCSNSYDSYDPYDSLVIRFSGGQQAGHHVVLPDGKGHVFSNFGSGTLQKVPTYWSKYCTVDPVGILNELDVLKAKDVKPNLYIDSLCPVTTPYDKAFNVHREKSCQHGSCQVGVGATYQREEDFYHLRFKDLFNKTVLKMKLAMIREQYYNDRIFPDYDETNFLYQVEELISSANILRMSECPKNYEHYIFEGSQGLLLDQHYGFFPHVSRGNFGTKNILDMDWNCFSVILVTRAYQTRHGNGPMTNENILHNIETNPYEQNFDDGSQGKFRVSLLDLDLLKHSIYSDDYISCFTTEVTLMITCLDLIKDDYRFTLNEKIHEFKDEETFVDGIKRALKIKNVLLSRTPFPEVDG